MTAWTQDNAKEAARRYLAGESFRQIGDRLGFSRNAVCGKLHRLGVIGQDRARAGRETGNLAQRLASTKHRPPPQRPALVVVSDSAVPFLKLKSRQCKFPLDMGMGECTADSLFCGAKTLDGHTYCATHEQRVFLVGVKKPSVKALYREARRFG